MNRIDEEQGRGLKIFLQLKASSFRAGMNRKIYMFLYSDLFGEAL